jgi:lysophospholipase L1-like esterase
VWACPTIDRLIDLNSNQSLKPALTGDSIVWGVGDTVHEGEGGYVARLRNRFPQAVVENLGVRGITTQGLLRATKANLSKDPPGETARKFTHSDIVLIAVGVNDYFDHGDPSRTVTTIKCVVSTLGAYYRSHGEVVPLIKVAYLTPTTRAFQRPFVSTVNQLMRRFSSNRLPMGPHFETLPTALLSSDGLHPSPEGYSVLSRILSKFIRGQLQKEAAILRPDGDNDGVYDIFEGTKYFTDPTLRDTDRDGFSDGEEIFVFQSDPLDSNSPTGGPNS